MAEEWVHDALLKRHILTWPCTHVDHWSQHGSCFFVVRYKVVLNKGMACCLCRDNYGCGIPNDAVYAVVDEDAL